ncbi:YeiH family protein [Falsibacillus pallidus]|uniref:Putative integral membrane protein (TIGR00698 family) n=1 Tax=Falsibacillus pallidus TaxID=493781 RepID=A0A370GEZ5_9BACI|nr:putative sulfate exporter family transporter [Falsibacillus pallidus]RDI42257.1 putative integral membrane protein (TIGR00698 family) [Falsibacillus pallidus]
MKNFTAGILFTGIIALLGTLLSKAPFFSSIGPLASAILLAIVYRQLAGYPVSIKPGIDFSSKKLLRLAIILFGLRLNIILIVKQGPAVILLGIFSIVFSIFLMIWLGKKLKSDASTILLLGAGTGICGAAAIAAIAPIIKAKEEDTALSVGIIALMGTIFSVTYTLLYSWFPIQSGHYALWSGVSLHEIAHVALAAEPAGGDALALALLAKLGRVLLLIPVSFAFMYWMKKRDASQGQASISFPYFLIGFVLMSIAGTLLDEKGLLNPQIMDTVSKVTTFILTMAMTGLGLNIHFKQLKDKAMRPLLTIFIVSIVLSVATFFLTMLAI